ncbi:MAG: hypothetical protein AAGH15_23200, partial [Myxococcota bacterium]
DEDTPRYSRAERRELLARRQALRPAHRWLGVSTWAAMTATVFLGTIQYWNLYGGSSTSNPCVTGNAILGQEQCFGTPTPHLATALITTGLYTTTFGLSLAMPDPVGLDQGDSLYARKLRRHKRLRWVHAFGMLAQLVTGIIVANPERFGMDRFNDYARLRGLASMHLALGYVTYGTMTWAGILFLTDD